MRKIKAKQISAIIGMILVFTMLFGTGSVFAYGGHPPLGQVNKIDIGPSYVLLDVGEERQVTAMAVCERGSMYINSCADFQVDHKNVIDFSSGTITAKERGVATITVSFSGSQAQITVEVR